MTLPQHVLHLMFLGQDGLPPLLQDLQVCAIHGFTPGSHGGRTLPLR